MSAYVKAPHDTSYKQYGKSSWKHYAPATGPLTAAQKAYLLDVLLKDKAMPSVQRCKYVAEVPTYTKGQASTLITTLKELPWKTKEKMTSHPVTVGHLAQEAKISEQVVQGPGFYQGGSGATYSYLYLQSVKKPYKVWKRLIEKKVYDLKTGEWVKKGSYVKISGFYAAKDINDGGKKLTIEEVKAHGHLMGYCLCCGKQLTDPVSVEQKVGPVCLKTYSGMLGL
jgi:hypothetical protein